MPVLVGKGAPARTVVRAPELPPVAIAGARSPSAGSVPGHAMCGSRRAWLDSEPFRAVEWQASAYRAAQGPRILLDLHLVVAKCDGSGLVELLQVQVFKKENMRRLNLLVLVGLFFGWHFLSLLCVCV